MAGGGKANNSQMPSIGGGFVPMSPRMMSPSRDGGSRGGRGGGGRGQRDKTLIGQTVRVAQGPFKGYIGIVKDSTETLARVELHTNCKTISVDRGRLAIISGQDKAGGGATVYGHTPMYGSGQTPMYGNQTPSYGNQTPMYGNQTPSYGGSRTPNHDGNRTPNYGSRTPSHDPSRTPSHGGEGARTPSHAGIGGAWDPTQPNTPARPSDEFDFPTYESPVHGGPSPAFGTTLSPSTPSHPGNTPSHGPFTPGTPNVFGGDSTYSPLHTPSPMHGNPMTPGSGIGSMSPAPQTPMYTPHTPLTHFDEETEAPKLTTDIEVRIANDYQDQRYANKLAVVRALDGDMVALTVYDDKSSLNLTADNLEIVRPAKKDKVKIVTGDDKDDTGVLINIDGPDGIIKMDQADQQLKMLQLEFLAKYVPPE